MLKPEKVPILLVDDRPENLRALEALLADPDLDLVTALSGNEALRLSLKTDFALVLLDVQMPEMDGFETAEWLRSTPRTLHLPIIFVTAGMKEDHHLFKGYETGAVDYLLKPVEPSVLKSKVRVFCDLYRQRHEIERHDRDLAELVKTRTASLADIAEQLDQSRKRYRRLLESITSYVYTVEVENGKAGATRHRAGCETVTGYSAEEFQARPGIWYDMLHPADRAGVVAAAEHMLATQEAITLEHRIHPKDGPTRWVRNTLVPHVDDQGRLCSYDGIIVDITERKRAEEERRVMEHQLLQSQKLESLGSLAGGVAHDINNVLTAIQAVTQTLTQVHGEDPGLLAALATIEQASIRGRDLVKGLTNFARQDLHEVAVLDLNDLVAGEMDLLRRTTLQKVELLLDLERPLPAVLGDRTSLGSVLMNLCINAIDAMPRGGALTLRTRREADATVALSVTDTGEGMPPEVLQRAMEPFFTTKAFGKGTGLGLSMAYGTAKAHGGTVTLQSKVGQGTTVTLHLPAVADAVAKPAPAPAALVKGRPLSILLVDDDDLIRASVAPMLECLGHRVVAAASGREALDRLAAEPLPDLMILDLNMPEMGGAETLERLRATWPALPVLIATGFLDAETQARIEPDPQTSTIAKPFSLADLARGLEAARS